MRPKKVDLESNYSHRRRRILKQIRGEAALFVSASPQISSRDQEHPYRPNSDLFYLTGISEPESALLLLGGSKGPRSVLFLRDRDLAVERWQGERIGLRRAKLQFNVDEVRDISQLEQDLRDLLIGLQTLYFSPGTNRRLDAFIWSMFQTNTSPRTTWPSGMRDARVFTSEMRMIKDRDEIRMLRHAAEITARSFLQVIPLLPTLGSEVHAARVLESYFAKFGARRVAFPTIVAAGKNASFLHHVPGHQPLWRKELVLIDAGASYRGYAGDITRTVPVSGRFTIPQACVYDIVHRAHQAAIKKARPGNTLREVHEAAVSEITAGLVGEKILKGKVQNLVAAEKHKRYFMHRTSHWLGLDTHDISPLTASKSGQFETADVRPLAPGMVLTIEPGLYFESRDDSVKKHFRGIGVRIEDDLLITENGSSVLSSSIPAERSEIEALMRS